MKLSNRMKKYERTTHIHLPHRTPVIVRVDGRAFHTFTKGFEKPLDLIIDNAMSRAAHVICKNIPCVKLAYGQSDEISFLLIDYDTYNTQQAFDGDVAKINSVFASEATAAFNEALFLKWKSLHNRIQPAPAVINSDIKEYLLLSIKIFKATFDCRTFSVPREDVANYFLWRLHDATRNSINALAQAQFTHKELHGIKCDDLIAKIQKERNINWHDCSARDKFGFYVSKDNPILMWDIVSPKDPKTWMFDKVDKLINPEKTNNVPKPGA